jgi:transcriptional regulator with XRE-family HTH domain
MRLNLSKDWYERAGASEAGLSVSAGKPGSEQLLVETDRYRSALAHKGRVPFSFARFVNLIRRSNQLTIEALARKAKIDPVELRDIEQAPEARVEAATISKLAEVFGLPRLKLIHLANLTPALECRVREADMDFAGRAKPAAPLTGEEQAMLREALTYLSEP